MKRYETLLFTLIVLVLAFALPASAGWEKVYGGTGEDIALYAQQTTDGGYMAVGYTNSFGMGYQIWLIKTNAGGDTLWTRAWRGGYSYGTSGQQTSDGGYIIAGVTSPEGSYFDICLIKTDASGNVQWTRTYGGSPIDWAQSVQQTSDGGYIVAGTYDWYGTDPQVYLIKTNAGGDTLWTRTYGSGYNAEGSSVRQTSDGGYIVAGHTGSSGYEDAYLIKTNAGGNQVWSRWYGGVKSDWGYSVQQTTDGGYIVAGKTMSFGIGIWYNYWLIKTNAGGDTLWTRTYGEEGDDYGTSVQQTSDGGYIVAGFSESFGGHGGYDFCLIKTNAGGGTLWTRTFGGASDERCWCVQQTSDRGYILPGYSTSFGNGYQVYLVKTDSLGSSGVEEERVEGSQGARVQGLTAKPNPFVSFATVPGHERESFALFNVSGRKVGTYNGSRIGEGLRAGVYFLKAEGKDAKPVRIVKLR